MSDDTKRDERTTKLLRYDTNCDMCDCAELNEREDGYWYASPEVDALLAELRPLAEIGRLAVARRKAQISKDNTPAGDLREVLLRRANLLDADADLDDAIDAYLSAHRDETEAK